MVDSPYSAGKPQKISREWQGHKNNEFSTEKIENRERNLETHVREDKKNKVKTKTKSEVKDWQGRGGEVDDTATWLSTECHCPHWAFPIFREHFWLSTVNESCWHLMGRGQGY